MLGHMFLLHMVRNDFSKRIDRSYMGHRKKLTTPIQEGRLRSGISGYSVIVNVINPDCRWCVHCIISKSILNLRYSCSLTPARCSGLSSPTATYSPANWYELRNKLGLMSSCEKFLKKEVKKGRYRLQRWRIGATLMAYRRNFVEQSW